MTEPTADITRIRREPPPLVPVVLTTRAELSPRMFQFTFEGDGIETLADAEPAASVRLLVPSLGSDELVMPEWNGNEFLLPDGERPALRTFTPLRVDREIGSLDLQIVRHPGGAVSEWADDAAPGASAAISGPGSGYTIDTDADHFILLGDETAMPAIADLLTALPDNATVEVHIEIIQPDAQIPLPHHPGAAITWHVRPEDAASGATILAVAQALDGLPDTTRLWAAGEAASMQAIRTHLFKTLEIPRSQANIRGYWKPAR